MGTVFTTLYYDSIGWWAVPIVIATNFAFWGTIAGLFAVPIIGAIASFIWIVIFVILHVLTELIALIVLSEEGLGGFGNLILHAGVGLPVPGMPIAQIAFAKMAGHKLRSKKK